MTVEEFRRLRGELLDPRPSPDPPIARSVWIPASELAARAHELPSRTSPLHIADTGDDAGTALEWAMATGRQADLVPFEFGPNPPSLRLWEPAEFLLEAVDGVQPGRALDLACGSGREAVALASLGWSVSAVDLLPDAIDRGRDLERRYAPSSARPIRWSVADVLDPFFAPDEPLELVAMFRFLDRPLLARVAGWLAPGGLLVVETFTTTHRERHGRPRHALAPGELPGLVPGLQVLVADEGWRGEVHTARLAARRP